MSRGSSPIKVRRAGGSWQVGAPDTACRACHGDSAEGGSEGSISAPPLALGREGIALREWLSTAIERHRGSRGQALGEAMPRYRMVRGDIAALAAYISSLPRAASPGVTPNTVTIGVLTDGSPLGGAGREALFRQLKVLGEGTDAAGGLFGRTVRFADDAEGGYILAIGWDSDSALVNPAFSVRAFDPAAKHGPATLCGSLDPPFADRTRAVSAWIERQGIATAVAGRADVGSYSGQTVIFPHDTFVTPILAASAKRAMVPAETVATWGAERPETIDIVAPGDITARSASARKLLVQDQISPREALAIAVYLEASAMAIEALRVNGRRIRRMAVCDTLKTLARSRQTVSIISADGTVVNVAATE